MDHSLQLRLSTHSIQTSNDLFICVSFKDFEFSNIISMDEATSIEVYFFSRRGLAAITYARL